MIDKIDLEKIQISAAHAIDKELLRDMPELKLVAYIERASNSLVLQMHAFIYGKRKMFDEISWPLNWKEAFKERWFPKWLLKRLPVKYETRQYEAAAAFPSLKVHGHKKIEYLLLNGCKINEQDNR